MLKPTDSPEEISEVNVIPLADVCLVLVIIVMLISPMALQSMIQVQASQAFAHTPNKSEIQEKPIFVDITSAGFSVNNNALDSEYTLFRTLQKELLNKTDKTVLITSEESVMYEKVVRVLDIVKQSGAKSLSLVPRKRTT